MLSNIKKINECHLKELAVFLGLAIVLGAITTMMQRVGSRIPAYGLVAIASMMPMMAMAGDNGIRLMRDCDEDEYVAKMYPNSEIPNIRVVNGFKTIYRVPSIPIEDRAKQLARLKLSSDEAELHELKSAADIKSLTCSTLVMLKIPEANQDGIRDTSADFRFIKNTYAPELVNRFGDFMYTAMGASIMMNRYFQDLWNHEKPKKRPRNQILRHLDKEKGFVYAYLDLRVLNLENRNTMESFLMALTPEQKTHIILRK